MPKPERSKRIFDFIVHFIKSKSRNEKCLENGLNSGSDLSLSFGPDKIIQMHGLVTIFDNVPQVQMRVEEPILEVPQDVDTKFNNCLKPLNNQEVC